MRMFPHERSLVKRLSGKPFALLGVNSDGEGENVKQQLQKHQITWRSFKDERKPANSISKDWKVRAWPTLYLIDHKGVIRKRWVGSPSSEVLDRELDRLVAIAEKTD